MSIDQLSKELRKSRFRIRHYQQLSGPNESSSVRFLSFSVEKMENSHSVVTFFSHRAIHTIFGYINDAKASFLYDGSLL